MTVSINNGTPHLKSPKTKTEEMFTLLPDLFRKLKCKFKTGKNIFLLLSTGQLINHMSGKQGPLVQS